MVAARACWVIFWFIWASKAKLAFRFGPGKDAVPLPKASVRVGADCNVSLNPCQALTREVLRGRQRERDPPVQALEISHKTDIQRIWQWTAHFTPMICTYKNWLQSYFGQWKLAKSARAQCWIFLVRYKTGPRLWKTFTYGSCSTCLQDIPNCLFGDENQIVSDCQFTGRYTMNFITNAHILCQFFWPEDMLLSAESLMQLCKQVWD